MNQNQYRSYKTGDFVWNPFFRQWVLTPTRQTDLFWNQWLQENPDFLDRIQEARVIVLSLQVKEAPLSTDEIDEVVKSTVSKINQPTAHSFPERIRRPLPVYQRNWFQVAASLSLLLLAAWLTHAYYRSNPLPTLFDTALAITKNQKASWTEIANTTSRPLLVHLADGSAVTLAPASRISCAKNFLTAKREVYLTGEAFFDVTKDPAHPFFVYANGLVAKVLGTSFTIKAYESSREVIVEVTSGRVSVFAQADPKARQKSITRELEGVVLSPNQKIVYETDEVRMRKTLVEKPALLTAAVPPSFHFEDKPVSEVFATLEKAYGVAIIYDKDLMMDCPLTASLDSMPLYNQLTIICKAVEASYELVDGQIIIHSKGCKTN
ncbi:FecR family protein [Larkinella knui]|uniref:FecR family protein n=1 Tax=Larkinella knui TaxID=2025310 RepID=A0A3P1CP55_9BACT|nr:FecR family protein [Larkinella knui]RRB15107.1 FecR family protein [Larkinella knui]